jgi:tRNA(adenine34) deaminase
MGYMGQRQVDEAYMRLALEEAKKAAEEGEVPVGCIIVLDSSVLARGRNCKERDEDVTGHAEINAIRKAAQKLGTWRLEGCTVYVTLEPCMMCVGALIHSRIKRLVFAATDPKTGMAGSVADLFELPANHRVERESGILETESSALLRNFFAKKRS